MPRAMVLASAALLYGPQFTSRALFTDCSYDNIGIPRNWAIPANAAEPESPFTGARRDLARLTPTCGAFKVPTLRNEAVGTFYTAADGTPDLCQYNDLPSIFDGNVNAGEPLYTVPAFAGGNAPTLTAEEIDDVVAFLCTLTDGFDPANPSAYSVPAQCQPVVQGSIP